MSKLSENDIEDIKELYYSGESVRAIAEMYGISWNYAQAIIQGSKGNKPSGHIVKETTKSEDAITPDMIRKARDSIHIGDTVICLDAVEECNGRQAGKVYNKCEVTGVYPSIFTVRRPFWTDSFTYIDLIRQNGVMMEG